MSDQTPAPDHPGQDTQAAPPDGTQQQAVTEQPQIPEGYIPEDRYKEAQAWGTRASQEASQYRQLIEGLQSDDPDTRARSAQALGIEFLDDTPTDDTEPSPYLTREEWEQHQAAQQQREQEQNQNQRIADVTATADADLERLKVPEHLRKIVFNMGVMDMEPRADGYIDIETAYKQYVDDVRAAEMNTWRSSKQAPFVSRAGQQATQTPNLDDDTERQAWMAAQLADLDAAT